MEFVRPERAESIDRVLAKSIEASVTYSDVGATLRGEQPHGYRHDRYEAHLGTGQRTFQRAKTGLQSWSTHKVPGIDVLPHESPIELGATVLVTFGTPWVALAAPCRIIGVLDELDHWG